MALGPRDDHVSRAQVMPDEVDKAKKIEDPASRRRRRSIQGAGITQVQVGLGHSSRRFVVANTDGVLASDHQVRTRFSVICVASGDTGMQTGYRPIAATLGFEVPEDDAVDEAARGAARQAITNSRLVRRRRASCRSSSEAVRRDAVPRGVRPRP